MSRVESVAAWLLLLLVASPALALEVEAEVGIDGVAVEGGWTPVTVRCTLGPNEPAFVGRVVLDRPREAVAAYSAPVRVAPGETTVARFVVPALTAAPWVVRVEDESGRTAGSDEPAAPKMAELDDRVVILASRSGLPSLGLVPADHVRMVRVPAEALPRAPEVLRDVSAIVLAPTGDAALVELARDRLAVATLDAWVRRGGVLVFTGGGEPFWRGSELDRLVPARCDGERDAEAVVALSSLIGAVPSQGPAEGTPAPIPVLVAAKRDGAVVEAEGDRRPLVIRRDHGLGRVVLVTFDPDAPGLRGASRMSPFLRGLTEGRARGERLRPEDLDPLIAGLIETTPPLGVGWFYGLAFAALAQVGGIALLAGFASRRRGPLAGLVVTPAVSIAVAAAVLLAGSVGRGQARGVVLVVTLEDGPARQTIVDVSILAGEREAFTLDLPQGLRPEAMAPVGLDVTALRSPRPTLAEGPEGRARVGPFAIHAHGTARLVLAGAALELPPANLEVHAAGAAADSAPLSTSVVWPQVNVRALEPVDELVLLSLRTSGARAGHVATLAKGGEATFDPAKVTTLSGEAPAADLPSLAAPGGRARLLEQVARVLHDAWLRALTTVRDPDHDPLPLGSAWALRCDVGGEAPLVIRNASGDPLPIQVVRVTCVSAARAP